MSNLTDTDGLRETADDIYDAFVAKSRVGADLDTELAAYVVGGLGLEIEPGTEAWAGLESLVHEKIRDAIMNIVVNQAGGDSDDQDDDAEIEAESIDGGPFRAAPGYKSEIAERLYQGIPRP